MAESNHSFSLAADEKATPVMVYAATTILWGQMISKEMVRVSTFLRTITPDYVSLHDARILPLQVAGPEQSIPVPEVHVRTPEVIGFHLLPPASEPPDYDPNEANRKMDSVSVIVGPYRFDGLLRTSTMTDLQKHLEITRETFVSLYEIEVSLPGMPAMGVIKSSQALIRRDVCIFAPRL